MHVAIIMDGNGRWATREGVSRLKGHTAGMEAMKEIVRKASHMGIKYLTVYAFSTENWKRTMEEVSGIFKLLVKLVKLDLSELDEENVRVRVLGDYSVIPDAARKSLDKTLATTEDNTGMQFNVAVNYGSRAEIVRGVNKLAEKIRSGELTGDITEEMISRSLYTGDENGNVPDPDLIIRTNGHIEDGFASINWALNRSLSFTAVACFNDLVAMGAIKALSENNYRVPDDIEVFGFDNLYISQFMQPSLSTVDVPKFALGKIAIETLLRHIGNPQLPYDDINLNTRLIFRKSTNDRLFLKEE